MTNGGTNFRGDLLLVTTGRGSLPPSIVRVNPEAPHNTTVLLDNLYGRQFNSLNDIKIHPLSGAIFFTDSTCVVNNESPCSLTDSNPLGTDG